MIDIEKEVDSIIAFLSQGGHSAEKIRQYFMMEIKILTEQAFKEGLNRGDS